ncbi:MAG: transglutaminase-like domain-containing protein [Bacteroidales bacterium]|nr:transglutaminase-like domain-containing protein [Bacteroidales bacterium]
MNKSILISGKTKTLKNYANVYDTIAAIKRIIKENYPDVRELAFSLQAQTDEQTFRNIWNFVTNNIKYQNDQKGYEQLRTPQRTLHDEIGDCDDFSILISAILANLGHNHKLVIAAYKSVDKWQHIYPVAYSSTGKRYVIDCVPEIPVFNYEAKPIKNRILINMSKEIPITQNSKPNTSQMKLEELGLISETEMIEELREPFNINSLEGIANDDEEISLLQGLLGNVAIVDEDDEYDTVLSGSELKQNIIIKQLVEAKTALEKEIASPTNLSQINDTKTDLVLIKNIIVNFDDEDDRDHAIELAIGKNTLYQNFYKTIQYGVSDLLDGLAGEDDDDLYYLKLMKEEGILDEIIDDDFDIDDFEDSVDLQEEFEGLSDIEGRKERQARRQVRKQKRKAKGPVYKKLGQKVKKGVSSFKKKHPKLAKFGHAVVKYSPATFAGRKALELFIRGNAFKIADKLAIGYISESQAKALGYTKAEWQKFVQGKDKAESKWYSIGGKKAYFQKMIKSSKAGKKVGLRGTTVLEAIGIAPAIVAAALKIFGSVIGFFKNLKLKRKDGTEIPDTEDETINTGNKSKTKSTNIDNEEMENEEFESQIKKHEKSGVTAETVTDEEGNETIIYKDTEGNEINKFKAFFLKNKTMIIVVSIVLVVGIVGLIIWKIRQRSLHGLGAVGLTKKQENFIKKQGLNNRAYASLVREEIGKDGKSNNQSNRKTYYKKVFREAYKKPLTSKQTSAALEYNSMYKEVRELAKQKGGGTKGWKAAWAEVKKKSRN